MTERTIELEPTDTRRAAVLLRAWTDKAPPDGDVYNQIVTEVNDDGRHSYLLLATLALVRDLAGGSDHIQAALDAVIYRYASDEGNDHDRDTEQ